MRIAILQFSPRLGDFNGNVESANRLLDTHALENPGKLPKACPLFDLLVLPELAFTGYNHTAATIRPLLEPTCAGPSTVWAIATAKKYQCIVSLGYPELASTAASPAELQVSSVDSSHPTYPPWPTLHPSMRCYENYNSTVTVSPTGEILAHYRKRHLYYTDVSWAREPSLLASDWRTFDIPTSSDSTAKTLFGICMDLNPYRFLPKETTQHADFADKAAAEDVSLAIVSMAWLSSPVEARPSQPNAPDEATLRYWCHRLSNLIFPNPSVQASAQPDSRNYGPEADTSTIIVLANRSGHEPGSSPYDFASVSKDTHQADEREGDGVVYAGTSLVARARHNGTLEVLGMLGHAEQAILCVDVDTPCSSGTM